MGHRVAVVRLHQKMGTAAVLGDQGFEQGLARAGPERLIGEQAEEAQGGRKGVGKMRGAAHGREMFGSRGHDVAGRVQEQDARPTAHGRVQYFGPVPASGKRAVQAAQHRAPAALGQSRSDGRRCLAQGRVIAVDGEGQPVHGTGHPVPMRLPEIGHRAGMGLEVVHAKEGAGRWLRIDAKDAFHVEGGQHETFAVAQGEAFARPEFLRQGVGHVQTDGQRPGRAVGQAHDGQHVFAIALPQEAGQWCVGPGQQQLQVADLARRQGKRSEVERGVADGVGLVGGQQQGTRRLLRGHGDPWGQAGNGGPGRFRKTCC